MNDELENVKVSRIDYYSELARISKSDVYLSKTEVTTVRKITVCQTLYAPYGNTSEKLLEIEK